MKLRQRKRIHMCNKRAQLSMWMRYQHARTWAAIERSLANFVISHGVFRNGLRAMMKNAGSVVTSGKDSMQ